MTLDEARRGEYTGRCSSCSKPILWGVTSKGKRIPIDVDPAPNGNIRLKIDGAALRVDVLNFVQRDEAKARGEPLYITHLASCVDGDQFRKARQ
jgi:hypothetical protein